MTQSPKSQARVQLAAVEPDEDENGHLVDTEAERASIEEAPVDQVDGDKVQSEQVHGEQAAAEESVDALRKLATGLAKEATKDTDDPVAEPAADRAMLRVLEAKIFASDKALTAKQLAESLPEDVEMLPILEQLQAEYKERGVNLVRVAGRWSFRTAEDLAYLMEREVVEERRLSRAALETLAIIAYHQPTTRAEIEEVRGVSISKGTLDTLMEVGWVRPRGRRRAPGKPLTYGTTEEFLLHFGLDTLSELPGLGELKGAGLLDAALPPDFRVPQPKELAALMPDELPLEDEEESADPELDFSESDDIDPDDMEPDDLESAQLDDEDQNAVAEPQLPSEKQAD